MKKFLINYPLGALGAFIVFLFIIIAIYAPLFASSKPLFVVYHGEPYFPLLRYLFYPGFFTKPLDLFFNILMITFPLALLFYKFPKILMLLFAFQWIAFFYCIYGGVQDPKFNQKLADERQLWMHQKRKNFDEELAFTTPYERLEKVLHRIIQKNQDEKIARYAKGRTYYSRYAMEQEYRQQGAQNSDEKAYMEAEERWLKDETKEIRWLIMPFIRPFHWEEDAGGDQRQNSWLPWWELTRINRKDLTAGLIFGIRISLVVGFLAIGLACLIGIPIGAYAGYYGGTFDIIVSRLLEIWESMPTFFMLLLVVSIMQSKNIFIVISVIGIFGWTTFSRFVRGEFFKQRSLAYVEAAKTIGFSNKHLIFNEILPNAIPPLLTLLPFAIMGAISSEAGLSFLGLGEEGSSSWGVLMDEGRSAFPGEAYLLWPPAILLTILLVAIALIGDALRDALDPKLKT